MILFRLNANELDQVYIKVESEMFSPDVLVEGISTISNKKNDIFMEFWSKIKGWIGKVSFTGKESIREVTNDIELELDRIKNDFGESAPKFFHFFSECINKINENIFSMIILSLPNVIKNSEVEYNLNSISVSLELKAGGDLKFSLIELLKFIAEGKLSVTIDYKNLKLKE